jgi:hypothetical protein
MMTGEPDAWVAMPDVVADDLESALIRARSVAGVAHLAPARGRELVPRTVPFVRTVDRN